ncbi:MAG: DUF421 domain-containing protein [Deltaproteobacteria bacterium]|nr:DUF421 domain-containing protein [Deltaproteobacteria bacterium]
MLFDVYTIFRTVTVAIAAYLALIVALRATGKRTLSKWNAFDLIVTVAIGSAFATTIVSSQTTLAQGITAFLSLALLQFAVTWLSVRSRPLERLVKANPRAVLVSGRMIEEAMTQERVSEAEVLAAIRQSGSAYVEDIYAVILETDGSFSVLKKVDGRVLTALKDVGGMPN